MRVRESRLRSDTIHTEDSKTRCRSLGQSRSQVISQETIAAPDDEPAVLKLPCKNSKKLIVFNLDFAELRIDSRV